MTDTWGFVVVVTDSDGHTTYYTSTDEDRVNQVAKSCLGAYGVSVKICTAIMLESKNK